MSADADDIQGWANAYIGEVGPGEYSIDLIDDAGMPGNATHMQTLTFSLPATGPAGSQAEQDARVIKAATEELAENGYIPDSDFKGGGDRFRVLVGIRDWAMEALYDAQRSPEEKLDSLLAELAFVGRRDPSVGTVQTGDGSALIDGIPELGPGRPGGTGNGGGQVSIIDWEDEDGFLRAVVAERPATVYVERYQGGYAQRFEGWGDVEFPSISDLEDARDEAVQRDQELGGFTAAFRSEDSVHRYLVRADWVEDLEERLEELEEQAEWLMDVQRPSEERLDSLLAELEGIRLGDPSVGTVQTGDGSALIDGIPELGPGRPDGTGNGGGQVSIVDWEEEDGFLGAVVAERPATVYIGRYQGGYAERFEGWGDVEHPSITDLEDARVEAVQRDQELGGFTAAFRSGDSVHRYLVRAHWVEDLEKYLEELENRVIAARKEHARFPHLKEWGEQLFEALSNDDEYLTTDWPHKRYSRGEYLARSMFGPDCPMGSAYIRHALATVRVMRADILAQRQQEALRAAIPTWAAQLAAMPDFQAATTEAQRAMLASNFLHAHNPSGDTPELVRLLRQAAADLLG